MLLWSRALVNHLWPVSALLGAFAAALLVFRSPRFLPGQTRLRLIVESWSMVVFISGVLWFTGRSASPMLNLYLLPIILSALTLSRLVTLLQVGAICLCHVVLALSTPEVQVVSLAYASSATGELAPILLIAYLTSTLSADVTEARERIEDLAQNDTLTGLLNARAFNEAWRREHEACEARRGTYSLLMIDVDKLKAVNEAFGHEAGDSALTLVAQCLQRSIRSADFAARTGGDEFAVLLPGASQEIAEAIEKRVRNNVYKTTLDLRSRMIRCSVSIGIANYPGDGRDMRDLLSIADRNMSRDQELRRAPSAPARV